MNSQPVFGLAGVIDLEGRNPGITPEALTKLFVGTDRAVPGTVRLRWQGDGMAAAAVVPCDDARLTPGGYTFDLPEQGGWQGLAFGPVFGNPLADSWSDSASEQPWPLAFSEAMVAAYVAQGNDAFNLLNGACLAVLVNPMQRRVVLARNEAGLDMLYVTQQGQRVIFANNLDVFRLLGLPLRLDEQGVAEFLHYLFIAPPRTIYAGIEGVQPGHVLVLDASGTTQKAFAPPRFAKGQALRDPAVIKAAVEKHLPEFEALLHQAVRDSLPARGRVGILLSGGLDSTGLAVAMSHVAPDRIQALTIGALNPAYDEIAAARETADYLGLPHSVCVPDAAAQTDALTRWARLQDQPNGDPAAARLLLGLDHLPDDVGLIFDGQGNSSYFGALAPVRIRRYIIKRYLPDRLIPWNLLLALTADRLHRLHSFLRRWSRPKEEMFLSWDGWLPYELAQLWGRKLDFNDSVVMQKIRGYPRHDLMALYTTMTTRTVSIHAFIRKVTQVVQSTGRAVRYPYTDNRLAYFVSTLPQELKFQGRMQKFLLRAYLKRHLPARMVDRPKKGFVFDLRFFLEHNGDAWLSDLQASGHLKVLPFWPERVLNALLERYMQDPARAVHRIHALALLAAWHAARQEEQSAPPLRLLEAQPPIRDAARAS